MRFDSLRCLMVVVAAFVAGGCQNPGGPATLPNGHQNPSSQRLTDNEPVVNSNPDAPALGPIEVRETEYENGAVSLREEGYVGPDGRFVRHGPTATWYDDGVKKSEINYAHGKEHGMRTTWYPTGQMWGQGEYVNGAENGTWLAWWPNGFKQREWQMTHGIWDGPYVEWHDNGEKKMEFEYVNGLKQGAFRIWDPQGNLMHESEYVDDVEQPK